MEPHLHMPEPAALTKINYCYSDCHDYFRCCCVTGSLHLRFGTGDDDEDGGACSGLAIWLWVTCPIRSAFNAQAAERS